MTDAPALPPPDPPPIPPRRATLVLVSAGGEILGRLPELEVPVPWWPEAWPVVEAARERFGVEVTVLRLVDTERPVPHGGGVTYLAEVEGSGPAAVSTESVEGSGLALGVGVEAGPAAQAPVGEGLTGAPAPGVGGELTGALAPMPAEEAGRLLADHALRMSWARPGGPRSHLAWAAGALRAAGQPLAGRPRQVRTWNLSTIWELPINGGGSAWLKVVPPFFAHEGAMLRWLAGSGVASGGSSPGGAPRSSRVPRLLAADGPRLLLEAIPGEDRYDAGRDELLEMVDVLVDLQARCIGDVPQLLAMGLPDWRAPALTQAIEAVAERRGSEVRADLRADLRRLIDGLPARFSALAECGLPDTLVHGDAHPGNTRGIPGRPETLVLLDWGDCGVGHPLLDEPAFLGTVADAERGAVRDRWAAAWRAAVPGCDPERAAGLIAPIAAARQAVIYQRFVDGIEPAERRYHAADSPAWLERAASLG